MSDQVFQRMCSTHTVAAKDLVQFPPMIDSYPNTRLLIQAVTLGSTTALVFWCVEMLELKGWEADGWGFNDVGRVVSVVMRRP
ncbi:MAG: hypothetical protein ABIS86_03930 [Streptosporangiaceae bacterium]